MDKLERLEKIYKTLLVLLLTTSIEMLLVKTLFSDPLSTWNIVEFALYVIAMLCGFYVVLKEILKL